MYSSEERIAIGGAREDGVEAGWVTETVGAAQLSSKMVKSRSKGGSDSLLFQGRGAELVVFKNRLRGHVSRLGMGSGFRPQRKGTSAPFGYWVKPPPGPGCGSTSWPWVEVECGEAFGPGGGGRTASCFRAALAVWTDVL